VVNVTDAVPAALVVAANGGPAQLNAVRAGPDTEWVIVTGKAPTSLDDAVHGGLTAVPQGPANAREAANSAQRKTIVCVTIVKRQARMLFISTPLVGVLGGAQS
jgi:hypothetical protein